MTTMKSRLGVIALAAAAALWLGSVAPAAMAEDVTAQPPAAAGSANEAAASAVPGGESLEEGSLELNEAPASVIPGYGEDGPQCPHRRGKAELPSV